MIVIKIIILSSYIIIFVISIIFIESPVTSRKEKKEGISNTNDKASNTKSTPNRASDPKNIPNKASNVGTSNEASNTKSTPKRTRNLAVPLKASSSSKKTMKTKPFNKLMEGVVFVLSGYQNPLRSQLRDRLQSMGAKYKADWAKGCTHLM